MPLDQTDANRLKLILESMIEGWWEWNVTTNNTFHSPGWYKMLGIEPQDERTY